MMSEWGWRFSPQITTSEERVLNVNLFELPLHEIQRHSNALKVAGISIKNHDLQCILEMYRHHVVALVESSLMFIDATDLVHRCLQHVISTSQVSACSIKCVRLNICLHFSTLLSKEQRRSIVWAGFSRVLPRSRRIVDGHKTGHMAAHSQVPL